MADKLIEQCLVAVFGIIQALTVIVIIAAFKMFWDVRSLKKDMDAAFTLIRGDKKCRQKKR